MMLTRKSLVLLGVALITGAATLLPERGAFEQDLPTLPGVDRNEVRRIEITQGQINKLVIDGSMAEGFRVMQPFQAPADLMTIRPMLNLFREPIRADVRLDEGNLEDYGVDDQNGILVELFTGTEEAVDELPALSFVVGYDLAGGASFVRLKDSDEVFRARIGGRARYQREALDWKNRLVVEWDHDALTDIEITNDSGALHFQRPSLGDLGVGGAPTLGEWTELGNPEFPVDPLVLRAMAKSLATVRAGRILSSEFDGGFDDPSSVATIRNLDGESVTLTFGDRGERGQVYMKSSTAPDVWLVSESKARLNERPLEAFHDLQIFDLKRQDIASMSLTDVSGRRVLGQLDDGMWEVRQPRNVDADVKQILFSANSLADLRADAMATISDEDAGLDDPGMVFTIRLNGGAEHVLSVGSSYSDNRGVEYRYVGTNHNDMIYVVKTQTLSHIRRGFGRAD